MKKLLFLLALSTLIFSAAQAQFKVGIKEGLNIATYHGIENSTVKPVLGFHLGVFANFSFTDNISFQPEILFSRQGGKVERFNTNAQRLTIRDNFSYLTLPLLVKMNTSFGLTFESGFQFGYLVSGITNYEYEVTLINPNDAYHRLSYRYDAKDADWVVPGDVSFALGAGYELPSGLSINLRGLIGLSNTINTDNSPDAKAKNLVFQMAVGFPLLAF